LPVCLTAQQGAASLTFHTRQIQSSQVADQSARSSISGRVTESDGRPLSEASVILTRPPIRFKAAVTDADGRYELRDLPAGLFLVSVEKAGFISLAFGQTKTADSPKMVTLAANQHLDGVNIIVPRGGVIAGRVLDAAGKPIARAEVMPLRRFLMGEEVRRAGDIVIANDIGEFRMFGLPGGPFLISARAPRIGSNPREVDLPATGLQRVYYPGTTSIDSAQFVTVGIGETVSNITLSLVPVPLASISGQVVDAQGAPVTRGTISARRRDGYADVFESSVRPDGAFNISGLPPGDYLLRATATPGPAPFAESTATVTVNGRDVSGVVVSPPRKVNVSGRITLQGTPGDILGSMFRISFVSTSTEASMVGYPDLPVKDDFTFQLTAPATRFGFRVGIDLNALRRDANPGLLDWRVKEIRLGSTDITDIGVDLREGRDLSGVEIELTKQTTDVTFQVTNAKGEALPDFTVLVFPEEREQWIRNSRRLAQIQIRSPSGSASRIQTLPPGRYLAVAFESVQALPPLDPQFLDDVRDRATAFLIADGQGSVVRLSVDGSR
jgi:hypothetical protein